MAKFGVDLELLIRAIVQDELKKVESQPKPLPPMLAYTEREACRLLGMSSRSARHYRRTGQLRFSRVAGKAVYLPEHIEEFLRQHERGGKSRR